MADEMLVRIGNCPNCLEPVMGTEGEFLTHWSGGPIPQSGRLVACSGCDSTLFIALKSPDGKYSPGQGSQTDRKPREGR